MDEIAPNAVSIRVNGTRQIGVVESRQLLVHFLRGDCGLTGTHVGCDTSYCGACTVHLDGEVVKACNVFTVQADGREVRTIEGLETPQGLHVLQSSFSKHCTDDLCRITGIAIQIDSKAFISKLNSLYIS